MIPCMFLMSFSWMLESSLSPPWRKTTPILFTETSKISTDHALIQGKAQNRQPRPHEQGTAVCGCIHTTCIEDTNGQPS